MLHHAKIKLWSQSKCKKAYAAKLKDSMFCAGYDYGGIDSCKVRNTCCPFHLFFFSFHSFANSILNDDIKRCQVTRPDGVFTGRQRGSPGLSGSEPLDVDGGDYVGGVTVRTAPQAGGVYPSGRFHRVDHKHHPIIRLDLYLCHSFHGEFNHALR